MGDLRLKRPEQLIYIKANIMILENTLQSLIEVEVQEEMTMRVDNIPSGNDSWKQFTNLKSHVIHLHTESKSNRLRSVSFFLPHATGLHVIFKFMPMNCFHSVHREIKPTKYKETHYKPVKVDLNKDNNIHISETVGFHYNTCLNQAFGKTGRVVCCVKVQSVDARPTGLFSARWKWTCVRDPPE